MTRAAASGDHSRSLFATPAIVADRRADGSILVRSTVPLQPGARCVGDWLEHWARQAPDRIFLGDRAGVDAPWTTVTYRDALQQVRAAAAWILAQGLSAERPLVILSDPPIAQPREAIEKRVQLIGRLEVAQAGGVGRGDVDRDVGGVRIRLLEPELVVVDEHFERAFVATMVVLGAGSVETVPAFALGHGQHLIGGDVEDLGVGVDELAYQPRAGDAVGLRSGAGNPFHAMTS